MELMPRTRFMSLLVAGALATGAATAAEVYRWVDENGEVHYSESLPPDYKDKEEGFDVLNSSGLVVDENQSLTPKPPPPPKPSKEEPQELPRDSSGLPRPKALYSEAELQRQMDNFLMLRYESEQEIVDAMNVEIKQLEYDRRLLVTTRDSMKVAYEGEIREAANRQRAGQQVPDETMKDLDRLRSRLAENESSLALLQQREEAIRLEFDEQLSRFRKLQEEWAEESSGS